MFLKPSALSPSSNTPSYPNAPSTASPVPLLGRIIESLLWHGALLAFFLRQPALEEDAAILQRQTAEMDIRSCGRCGPPGRPGRCGRTRRTGGQPRRCTRWSTSPGRASNAVGWLRWMHLGWCWTRCCAGRAAPVPGELRAAAGALAAMTGMRTRRWVDAHLRRDPMAPLFTRAGSADPYPIYRQLREQGPFVRLRSGVRVTAWHRCCEAVLRSRDFGVRRSGDPTPTGGAGLDLGMLDRDPPDHTRLRRLVAPAFTPRAIEGYRPLVEATAQQLLDRARRDGGFDLVSGFAAPLPVTVITAARPGRRRRGGPGPARGGHHLGAGRDPVAGAPAGGAAGVVRAAAGFRPADRATPPAPDR